MMGIYKALLIGVFLLLAGACSDGNEELLDANPGYTAVQQKALEILDGVWVSDEVKMVVEMGEQLFSAVVLPSDTIVFLSKFHSPQTFYAYDYLQGKDVENFVACGMCEFRSGSSIAGVERDCYFDVSPSGDALSVYGVEKETLVRRYELRVESESRFYAGTYSGVPVYFNRQ